MTVTLTRLRKVDHPTVKAIASILVDYQLAIHDIKVLEYTPGKPIVAMPNKVDGKGVYREMVHPINQELRQQINDLLLDEYNKRRNDK